MGTHVRKGEAMGTYKEEKSWSVHEDREHEDREVKGEELQLVRGWSEFYFIKPGELFHGPF